MGDFNRDARPVNMCVCVFAGFPLSYRSSCIIGSHFSSICGLSCFFSDSNSSQSFLCFYVCNEKFLVFAYALFAVVFVNFVCAVQIVSFVCFIFLRTKLVVVEF